MKIEFDESKHPRDKNGQFAEAQGHADLSVEELKKTLVHRKPQAIYVDKREYAAISSEVMKIRADYISRSEKTPKQSGIYTAKQLLYCRFW